LGARGANRVPQESDQSFYGGVYPFSTFSALVERSFGCSPVFQTKNKTACETIKIQGARWRGADAAARHQGRSKRGGEGNWWWSSGSLSGRFREFTPHFFAPCFGPALMARGSFGAVLLAAARPNAIVISTVPVGTV